MCLPGVGASGFCSELTGLPGIIEPENYPGASKVQLAAIKLLSVAGFFLDTSDASTRVLQASKILDSGVILSLPDDQWIQEVVGWEMVIWASWQTMVSDYAVGYAARDPSLAKILKKNMTSGERQLCNLQQMRKSGSFMYGYLKALHSSLCLHTSTIGT